MSTSTLDPTRKQLDELDALLQRMLSLPVGNQENAGAVPPAPRPAVGPATTYTFSNVSMPQQMTFAAPQPTAYTPPPPPKPVASAPQPQPAGTTVQPAQTIVAPMPKADPSWTVPLPGVASGPSVLSWSRGFETLARKTPEPEPQQPSLPVNRAPEPAPQPNVAMPDPAKRIRIESISAPEAQASALAATLPSAPTPSEASKPAYAPVPFVLWPLAAVDWICGNILAGFGPVGKWFGKGSGKLLFGWAGLLMIGGAIAWGVMDYFGWSW